jgi:hypothetical protein
MPRQVLAVVQDADDLDYVRSFACWQRAPLTVASRQPCEVRISAPAFEDIAEIWDWTVERFGNAVPLR